MSASGLTSLDALFLNAEDAVTHLHIGSCAIFAGPPPLFRDVIALIESKLAEIPRYRQKLHVVPGGLGHPVWVDDAGFDLGYHVRHTALPAPGGTVELEDLIGRLMSQQLDRHRPLWETWVVDGLSDDRWALICKVHHCMVDGLSGTDTMNALLDPNPEAVASVPAPWTPEPAPGDGRLALGAAAELARVPLRQVGALIASARSPRTAVRRLTGVAAGVRSYLHCLRRATPLSLEGTVGSHRRFAAARCTLDDAKAIRGAFGGSVNDVVLAVISGAFRDLLGERGERVDGARFRSLVPVSLRAAGDSTPNNQLSMVIAELPIGIADPLERLAAVQRETTALKSSHQVEAGASLVAAAQYLPPLLQKFTVKAASAVLRQASQYSINTVTTNVPGPPLPLFALGRGMLEYLPFVPLGPGMRIGIAVLSYNGHLTFGVTGDYDTAADVHFMAERIEAAMDTLREHADLIPTRIRGRRPRRAKEVAH